MGSRPATDIVDRRAPADGVATAIKSCRRETHRVVTPEQTIERITVSGLGRAAGITRVANVTGLDVIGIHVVTVSRPNSRSLSVAQGKGITLAAAKASGMMEAIEMFLAERPQVATYRASYDEIGQRGEALDPALLARPRTSWYRRNLPLLWVEGRDLCRDAAVWVPFDLVHMDWTLPLPAGSEIFSMSSNGLASGNHRAEAISHAICELVERDATSLHEQLPGAEKARRRVALSTIDAPACLEALDRFRAAGVDVAIWETTTDIGIACFSCMVAEHSPSALHAVPPVGGEGCHPCRDIALLRALTEAAQKRLTMITGSRDDLRYPEYAKRSDPHYIEAMARIMREGEGERSFQRAPSRDFETCEQDVEWELKALAAVRLRQVVAIDVAHHDCGVHVVRVVVPGLESIHDLPGYVPGPRARAQSALYA